MTFRPLIAVVAYHLDGTRVARWPDGGYGVPAPYLDALRRAGARTAIVAPGEEADAREILDPFDGLLLVGGGDVDPSRYGAAPDTDHNYGVEPDRDAFEIALLHAADAAHLPTLCICRGMQIMNVAFGGTLHQHLPAMGGLVEHGVPLEGTETRHPVTPEPGSLLSATVKTPALACSSHHHQGVDAVGDRLRVSGRSPDGLVEGIELEGADMNHDSTWMVGVQWHPEETAADDPSQQRLFVALTQLARFRGQVRHGPGSRAYRVVDAAASWPVAYERVAERLRAGMPADLVVRIDHVGSTSVPDLAAKPVIDIQMSVASITPVASYAEPLAALGYDHAPDPWNDDHEFFSRATGRDEYEGFNLHVCAAGSRWEQLHLAFREWLRTHPEDAAAYAALKRSLAASHPRDIASYLDGKTELIERLTGLAMAGPVAAEKD